MIVTAWAAVVVDLQFSAEDNATWTQNAYVWGMGSFQAAALRRNNGNHDSPGPVAPIVLRVGENRESADCAPRRQCNQDSQPPGCLVFPFNVTMNTSSRHKPDQHWVRHALHLSIN